MFATLRSTIVEHGSTFDAGALTAAAIVGTTWWRFALPEHVRKKVLRKIGVGRNRAPAISTQSVS